MRTTTPGERDACRRADHSRTGSERNVPVAIARNWIAPILLGSLMLLGALGFDGVSSDNTHHLLAAYARLDPGFLANDWFTHHTQSFHAFFEVYAAWWLARDALLPGLFVWYAINLLALSAALVITIRHVGTPHRRVPVLLAAIGLLLVGVRAGWGEYQIISGQALPAYLGYPPALVGIVLVFQRRYLWAAAAVAIAFTVHQGLGALMVLVLIGPLLVERPRTRREIVEAAFGVGLVALCLLPTALGALNRDAGAAEAFEIFFYGRAPHHYAIRFAPAAVHLASVHVLVTSVVLALAASRARERAALLGLAGGVFVLCALGVLLLEVWYVPAFIRLFPYRALPLVIAVNACVIAARVFGADVTARERGSAAVLALSGVGVAFVPVAAFALLPVALALASRAPQRPGPGWPVAIGTAIALVAALVHARVTAPPLFFRPWPSPIMLELRDAIAEVTPPDAILSVPPWLTGVRLAIDRAIVVNWKNFPVYGPEMVAWADRMRDVTGVDPRDARTLLERGTTLHEACSRGYQERGYDELVRASRRYGATHVLVQCDSPFHWQAKARGVQPVWAESCFELYRL